MTGNNIVLGCSGLAVCGGALADIVLMTGVAGLIFSGAIIWRVFAK